MWDAWKVTGGKWAEIWYIPKEEDGQEKVVVHWKAPEGLGDNPNLGV